MMQATWMRLLIGMALAAAVAVPGWAEDEAEAPAEEAAAPAAEEAPMAAEPAPAPVDVWWGNRAVSFRNYIPFDGVAGGNHCAICDQHMRDCATGLPCNSCDKICPDCNCVFNISFDKKKSVLSAEGQRMLNEVIAQLNASAQATVSIQGDGAPANAVRRYLQENGVAAEKISSGAVSVQQGPGPHLVVNVQ